MANIKFKKPLLSAAILACLFGGALTTIGSTTGGVNDLVNSAKSKVKVTKKEENLQRLKRLVNEKKEENGCKTGKALCAS